MAHLFTTSLLFVALVSCSTTQKALTVEDSNFSGTYECDGYVAKAQNESVTVEPFLQTIEHKKVNGLDFIVVKRSDSAKNIKLFNSNPGNAEIYVADGNWRFTTFSANGELLSAKKMTKFSEDGTNTLIWKAEVPAYTTNGGKKLKAANYGGKMWIDPISGDKMSQADFVDKPVACKRRSSAVNPF